MDVTTGPVLATREEGDLARSEETPSHDVVVVRLDPGQPGSLVETGFGAALLDRAVAHDLRGDTVERRRLVETHEGVGVPPVPPGA
jgi:hypothetical protein